MKDQQTSDDAIFRNVSRPPKSMTWEGQVGDVTIAPREAHMGTAALLDTIQTRGDSRW